MHDKNTRVMLGVVGGTDADLERTDFQVLRTGEFFDQRYGKFSITEDLLKQLKKNFDEKVLGVDVALDVNHEPEKGAMAWLSSLEVREGGLWARFRDFTSDAAKAMREKMFRYFSVEFRPFTKVEDGKKVTINDVLRGIALTNRPVIKGMQATFFSEGDSDLKKLFITTRSMNAVKVFCESLIQRGKVLASEVASLKLMIAALGEDEQKDVKELAEKVEAEAKSFAEAETTRLAEEKEAADKKAKEGQTPEQIKAAEAKAAHEKELAERDERIAKLELAEKGRKLDEAVDGVILAEDNLTGFPNAKKEDVKKFMGSLSEEQRTDFSALVKGVQTVDKAMLSEIGSGKQGEEKTLEVKLAEANTEAKARAEKSGRELHIELAEVIAERGLGNDDAK